MYQKKVVRTSSNPLKFLKVFFIIFGLVFVIAGGFAFAQPKIKAQHCTESVPAEVTENITHKSSTHSTGGRRSKHRSSNTTSISYQPVFEFEYNGQSYTVKSDHSSNPPAFDVGEKVELKINPDDPTDFYAPADNTYNLLGIIFAGLGLIFAVIGFFLK